LSHSQAEQQHNPQYGRTAFNGVLRHNDRINAVNKLMKTVQNVNKYLNKNERQQPTEEKKVEPAKTPQIPQDERDMRWKKKFVKIWQEGDKNDKRREEEEKNAFAGWEEDSVGPEHFRIGAKLG
jgi:hypothetical protein